MRIEIVKENGDLIYDIELDSNPFKVGEILNLDVKNHGGEFWKNIKVFTAKYKIKEIEHYYNEYYGPGEKHRDSHSVSLTVTEIEYIEY